MGFFFKRLETYTEVTPTAAMTDIITEIMVEALAIFGIATKELRRRSASEIPIGCLWISTELCVEKFLRKLAGMTALEDALKRLDNLTQEEARMALTEVLRITHSVSDDVKVVIGGTRGVFNQSTIPSDIYTFRWKRGKGGGEGSKINYPTDRKQCGRSYVFVIPDLAVARYSHLNSLTGNQLKQVLRTWLSPADPSTNHNIARKAQHKGTAVWFFQGSIFIEWKSTGSLLWIHGKRAFLSASFGLALSDSH